MGKTARKITFGAFLFVALLGTFAAQEGPPAERYPTGLIPPTAEQLDEIFTTWPRIVKVNVNRLGFARINAVRAAKGMAPLPPNIIRPIGRETDTSIGAPEESTGRIRLSSDIIGDLPVVVDNSQTVHFPPIRNQSPLGSCASFSSVYTQLSYMTAFQRNLDITDNDDNTNKYSPKWAYNMLNGGDDSGSSIYNNYKLLERHGAATWAEFPYDSDYRAWCMDTTAWRNALSVRINPGQYLSTLNTESAIGILKELLTNGYVLSFGTYVYSWQFTSIPDDPATTDDDSEVGKSVAFWVNGEEGGHGMVIVGYNDAIWTDINGNGLVDAGEKGAFRIANSWGATWRDSGFTWLAYDALNPVSAVAGGPSTGRIEAFQLGLVYVFTARNSYTPRMIAEFTVNHAKRNQLAMRLGFSDTTATAPSWTWTPRAINYQGGAYAFDGTTTPTDGTFVYDATDLLQSSGAIRRFYLGMSDNAAGDTATLSAFKIVDLTTDPETEIVSGLVPQYADDQSNVYSYVDYTYEGPVDNHQPGLEAGQVNLPSGTTLDTYVFWVWYSDVDHDAPTVKNVYIDETPYAMISHPNYPNYDGWYYYPMTLSVGTHNFRFYFEDGRGGAVSEPVAGAFSGPVVVLPHIITPPTAPTGEAAPIQGKPSTYSTGGSSCNQGHDVQYRFDWGDGAVSDWLPAGETSASHVWGQLGPFEIRTQARCSVETTVVSAWSDALAIDVAYSPKVDFDSDGQEDILWRYQAEGTHQGLILAWLMDQMESPAPLSLDDDGIALDEKKAWYGRRAGALDQVIRGNEIHREASAKSSSSSIVVAENVSVRVLPLIPKAKIRTIMEGKARAVVEPRLSMRDATDRGPLTLAATEGRIGDVDSWDIPIMTNAAEMLKASDATTEIAAISRSSEVIIARVSDTAWEIAGTGDFNSDGKVDILWRYYGPGTYQGLNVIWHMDGMTRLNEVIFSRVSDTNWRIVGTGDFNSDGKVDILWRYHGPGTYEGLNIVWHMDGMTRLNEVIFSRVSDTNWRIVGTGDFNSDGKVDILWRYHGPGTYEGLNVIWHMDGITRLNEVIFSRVTDTAWEIGGTGDFDTDGRVDILWRYYGSGTYQGLNVVWYMDGATRLTEEIFSRVSDTNWRIVNR